MKDNSFKVLSGVIAALLIAAASYLGCDPDAVGDGSGESGAADAALPLESADAPLDLGGSADVLVLDPGVDDGLVNDLGDTDLGEAEEIGADQGESGF